jgi:hypothetical protein
MEDSQAIALHGGNGIIELGEDAIVSTAGSPVANPLVPNMAKLTAKIRALTIAMVGIFAMPLCGLMAGDENLWDRLQTLIEAERANKTQSTVLAVDTAGLNVRSKKASASTKALFEQAAMEHLARLHHTFNSWSERKQELMGSVSLKLMVDASGNVMRVEPENSHVNNSSFVKTVIDDVREWKFPKGSTEAAEITIPLLFIPKGMDPEMIVQWERQVRRAPGDDDSPRPLSIAMARPAVNGAQIATEPTAATPVPMEREQKSVAAAPAQRQIAAKPIAVATVAPTPKAKAQAKALVVVVANRPMAMRDNPRYSANTVREVQEATQLSILENRGDWLKVRSAAGGQVGFVRKEYVSPLNG